MRNNFKRFFSWPRRYFRSRGFGVHSPFAYAFICDVLREKGYSYYAYNQISRLATTHGDDRKALRLFARLVSRFSPSCIYAAGRLSPHIATVAPMVKKDVAFSSVMSEASMVWLGKGADFPDVLWGDAVGDAQKPLVVVTHRNPAASTELIKSIPCGMSFSSKHYTVAVVTPQLPRQDFELIF